MNFVDLQKAFDTVNHTLMLLVLKKYGFPPRLINVIARIYKTFKLNIKKGDKTSFLEYLSGVHQGDPLAPLLFVLVYQACMETLDIVRGDQLAPLAFRHFPDTKTGKP